MFSERGVHAYPNPAHHNLVAEVHTASENSLLRLTDNSGALMGEYPVNRSNDQMIISTGHLAPGIYYLSPINPYQASPELIFDEKYLLKKSSSSGDQGN